MSRYLWTLVRFVLLGAAITFHSGCTNPPPTANNISTATPEPTPDKAAIEAELTRIENDWTRILKERDAASVRKLESDDIMLLYPDGAIGSKDEDVKDIGSGALSDDTQEISDITVNVLDNDHAVVRSRTTVKSDKYKVTDGKCEAVVHEFRTLDTFTRRNGQWQIVASATIPVRNPAPAATPSPVSRTSVSPKPSPPVRSSPAIKPSPIRKPSPKQTASPT